jgi:phosphoribosylformylglycinamidine (FGAM) synthase-like amidotransferase family enzyme
LHTEKAVFHADEATLNDLEKNDQVLFRYSDEWGNIVDQANPNGAARNIAGNQEQAKQCVWNDASS